LFLLNINDIPNALNSPPRLFADDTCLITQAPILLVLNEKVNQELVNIYEWTKANKIIVNPINFISLQSSSKRPMLYQIFKHFFNNSPIELHCSVKYLNITIDYRLNFQDHINVLATKLSKSVGVLCKPKHT